MYSQNSMRILKQQLQRTMDSYNIFLVPQVSMLSIIGHALKLYIFNNPTSFAKFKLQTLLDVAYAAPTQPPKCDIFIPLHPTYPTSPRFDFFRA